MKPFVLLLALICAMVAPSDAHTKLNTAAEVKKLDELFSKVNADMNVLKKDMPTRPARTAASAESCPLTKTSLLRLRNKLNSRLKAASGSRCNIDVDSNAFCSQMVTLVQCAINAVKVGYIDAVQSSASMKTVETIRRTFNGITEVYTKEINVVKKSMTVKKHWFDAEKLHKDLNRLRKQLDETTKKLQERTNDLVSSYICRGKIQKAIKNYKTLETAHGTAIAGIIKDAYRDVRAKKASDPKVMKNFNFILRFISKLPGTGSFQVKGYKALESEMRTAKFEKSVQVIQLNASLKSATVSDPTAQSGIGALSRNIEPEVNFMIAKWARGIKKSSRSALTDLRMLGQYPFNAEAVKSIMPSLITQSFGGKLTLLTRNLLFLKRVPCLAARIEGFDTLARQMASRRQFASSDVFLLAYQLRKVYKHKRYGKMPKAAKTKLDSIKALLPKSVQEIVLNGKSCRITNRQYRTNLYADQKVCDRNHRFDYLWSPVENHRGDKWNFETADGGKSWFIKNEKYKGYLMAESKVYNTVEGRRKTFVWRKKNSKTAGSKWIIEPADGGKFVVFKNVFRNGEYMYADGNYAQDSHRRNLFTWMAGKPRGKIWIEAQFQVKCGQ